MYFLKSRSCSAIANHGALVWAKNLTQTRIRMESMAHAALIPLGAHMLGRVR